MDGKSEKKKKECIRKQPWFLPALCCTKKEKEKEKKEGGNYCSLQLIELAIKTSSFWTVLPEAGAYSFLQIFQ